MTEYHLIFIANRLHDPERERRRFTETIEAPDRTSAITQLYHKYEHVSNVEVIPDE